MDKFNSDGVKIVSQLGGGGGGITNINVSAGTTSQNLSNLVFSNSNKLSFGLNGSTITAIVSGINAFGASNTGNTLGNTGVSTGVDWVIAGTNNVTISESTAAGGPNTLWLSAAGGGGGASVNFSAGTTSGNLDSVVFSNSNGVSFGLNGSTITASAAGGGGLTNIRVSAGTTSNLLSDITFSNSNGVSFGLNASTITASIATSLTNIRVSAGTTSNLLSAITFSNSNNVSFGLDGSTITATATVATSLTNIRLSAGTTSNLLSAVTFSNSNGISFGINASTVTASHNALTTQTNQQMTLFATGNTTLSSTGTTNASSIIFRGSNAASVGITNGSILIDVPVGGGGGFTGGFSTMGNTAGDTGLKSNRMVLVGSNNITLSGSTDAESITISIAAGGGGGGITPSIWQNHQWAMASQTLGWQLFDQGLMLYPLNVNSPFMFNMTPNTMHFIVSGTVSTAAAFTRTVSLAFYTMVNSTQLSRAFSASSTWGTNAGNMNINDSFGGVKFLSFNSSQFDAQPSFSQTHYWMAFWQRSSSGTPNYSFFGGSTRNFVSASFSGTLGEGSSTNTTLKAFPFYGGFSVSFSTAMPASIAASDVNRQFAVGSQEFMPLIIFNNIGSRIV
jgi:hypothetical protein